MNRSEGVKGQGELRDGGCRGIVTVIECVLNKQKRRRLKDGENLVVE